MDYSQHINTAIKAAIAAGKTIMNVYNDPNSDFSVEKKADNSPLTRADTAAHNTIVEILAPTQLQVLSEEGRNIEFAEREKWSTFWMVDPLDGTKEFIKRNGEFTVNIALIHNGEPVMGVIYVPVKKELYFGSKQKGAFKVSDIDCDTQTPIEEINLRSIQMPFTKNTDGVVIVASRSHQSPETVDFIAEVRKSEPNVTLVSSGSSLKICLVAEGTADIYPRYAPTMEWDTAAGHAIASAAGCVVQKTDVDQSLKYNKENLLNPWFIVKRVDSLV